MRLSSCHRFCDARTVSCLVIIWLQHDADTVHPKFATCSFAGVEGYSTLGKSKFFAFPSIQQLHLATEESLRDNGFGYRARYIVETARALQTRPEGMLAI
jgi:hypothetical protein